MSVLLRPLFTVHLAGTPLPRLHPRESLAGYDQLKYAEYRLKYEPSQSEVTVAQVRSSIYLRGIVTTLPLIKSAIKRTYPPRKEKDRYAT